MERSKLSALQQEFLGVFFKQEDRFFLTGGAALSGFHLGQRETHDLDLFTLSDALDEGFAVARQVARSLGASLEPIQISPDFRRALLGRREEAIIGDDLSLPGGVSTLEMRQYLSDLVARLARMAFPG